MDIKKKFAGRKLIVKRTTVTVTLFERKFCLTSKYLVQAN